MGQCCPASDVVVGIAPAVVDQHGTSSSVPASRKPSLPMGSSHTAKAEIARRDQLLEGFQPQEVRILRQRFTEAKGDSETLSRQKFVTLFELSDMPKVSFPDPESCSRSGWRLGSTTKCVLFQRIQFVVLFWAKRVL